MRAFRRPFPPECFRRSPHSIPSHACSLKAECAAKSKMRGLLHETLAAPESLTLAASRRRRGRRRNVLPHAVNPTRPRSPSTPMRPIGPLSHLGWTKALTHRALPTTTGHAHRRHGHDCANYGKRRDRRRDPLDPTDCKPPRRPRSCQPPIKPLRNARRSSPRRLAAPPATVPSARSSRQSEGPSPAVRATMRLPNALRRCERGLRTHRRPSSRPADPGSRPAGPLRLSARVSKRLPHRPANAPHPSREASRPRPTHPGALHTARGDTNERLTPASASRPRRLPSLTITSRKAPTTRSRGGTLEDPFVRGLPPCGRTRLGRGSSSCRPAYRLNHPERE